MTDNTENTPEDGVNDEVHTENTATTSNMERLSIKQTSSWGGIFPIAALNAFLNIVTLSLWRFWGRTRVRRYLWSTTSINGTPLEYTGTGWELFRSFLFVMIAIFLPIYAVFFAGQLFLPPEQFLSLFAIAYIPFLLVIAWLFGIAVWIARRYRLSRTTWRGIRFGQAGSANGYAWASIGYGILTFITFGWYGPVQEMRLSRRLWGETFFGDQEFDITQDDDGLAAPLYPTFALFWFSYLIGYIVWMAVFFSIIGAMTASGQIDPETMSGNIEENFLFLGVLYGSMLVFFAVVGLLSLPYMAALLRRKAEIIALNDLRFRLRVDMWSLGWIYIINFVIIIFTLGLGLPFAQMRLWRYIMRRLEVDGEIDIDAIRQTADRGPRAGEGLADAFDIGNII